MTFTNPGACNPVRLGGDRLSPPAVGPHNFALGVFDLRLIRSALAACSVASVVRPLIKLTNRLLRQQKAELDSFDQYFANFGYVTPITPVVFNRVSSENVSMLHALNVHGEKNDVVSQDSPKYSVLDWNGYVGN